MRGSACIMAKFVSGALPAMRCASLKAFCETFAWLHQISRQADALTFFGGIRATREHHVHHSRGTDQPWQSNRAATANVDSTAAFGQRVIGRPLGDAHVRRGGKLKTAADHRAVQNSHGRHLAELNFLECSMPEVRNAQCLA